MSRRRLVVEAVALAAAVAGSTALLVASCLGERRGRAGRTEEPVAVERVTSAPVPAPAAASEPSVSPTADAPPAGLPRASSRAEDAEAGATDAATEDERGSVDRVAPSVRVLDAGQGARTAELAPAPGEPIEPAEPAREPVADASRVRDGGPGDGSAPPAPSPPPMGAGPFLTTPPDNRASHLPTSPDPEAGAGPFLLDRSTRWISE